MQSGLEIYITQKLYTLRSWVRERDRAVVIGAGLSFVPIFPACVFGFLISAMNLFLIHRGITRRSDQRLVEISLIVSVIFSAIWLTLIFVYGHAVISALIELITSPVRFLELWLLPTDLPNSVTT